MRIIKIKPQTGPVFALLRSLLSTDLWKSENVHFFVGETQRERTLLLEAKRL
jgi:hypothetical protein